MFSDCDFKVATYKSDWYDLDYNYLISKDKQLSSLLKFAWIEPDSVTEQDYPSACLTMVDRRPGGIRIVKTIRIHLVAADIFHGANYDPSIEVHHRDHNKKNWSTDNLVYATHSQRL